MSSLRHEIIKAYLNRTTKNFTLEDVTRARKKFEAAAKSKFQLSIKSVRDLDVNGIKIRIYRNNVRSSKLPVVVYFHGGGFVLGSIDSHDSVCRYICKYTNCAVVSVEYSLAPESLYPVPIKEGLAVLDWLSRFGAQEGLATSNIFLAGDSAGGNIALNIATVPNLATTLKGLVLIYPTLDPSLSTQSVQRYATGHFLTKSMLAEFWGLYEGGKGLYRLPTDRALKSLPPTLIIAAEKDVLRDEGADFADRLRSLNKEVEYTCYSDTLHGFMQFPKVASKKVQAFKRIATFIGKNSTES